MCKMSSFLLFLMRRTRISCENGVSGDTGKGLGARDDPFTGLEVLEVMLLLSGVNDSSPMHHLGCRRAIDNVGVEYGKCRSKTIYISGKSSFKCNDYVTDKGCAICSVNCRSWIAF